MGSHTMGIHGASQHTDVTREIFIPANECYILAGTPDSIGRYGVVKGLANSDEPKVYFTIKLPDDFDSFTKVEAVWISSAAAGNMYWVFLATYAAFGEIWDIHSDAPGWGVTATSGTNDFNVQEAANPLTLANLAAGDYLGVQFWREGANAADTLNTNMYLYGFLFTYIANQ